MAKRAGSNGRRTQRFHFGCKCSRPPQKCGLALWGRAPSSVCVGVAAESLAERFCAGWESLVQGRAAQNAKGCCGASNMHVRMRLRSLVLSSAPATITTRGDDARLCAYTRLPRQLIVRHTCEETRHRFSSVFDVAAHMHRS